MSLTRRRLFTAFRPPPAAPPADPSTAWVAARGREEAVAEGRLQEFTATVPGTPPVRISSNENPLGPGAHVLAALAGTFPEAHRYPFNAQQPEPALIAAIARKCSALPEQVVLGPGSGEILGHAVRAFTSASRPLVTAWPSFEVPREVAGKIGTPVTEVGLDAALRIDVARMADAARGAGLVFFCNPNNPTATVHGRQAVVDLVAAIRQASPDTVVLIDEAYHDYVIDPAYRSSIDLALATPNVIVTRTFSKAYGMAGLRVGYAVGHAPTIRRLQALKTPYALGTLALGGAVVALGGDAHVAAERDRNTAAKAFTVAALGALGFTGTDSQTNFIFVDLKRPAAAFREACRAQGVLVGRDFPPFEKQYCRISIGTMGEMQRAVAVFRKVLGGTGTAAAPGR